MLLPPPGDKNQCIDCPLIPNRSFGLLRVYSKYNFAFQETWFENEGQEEVISYYGVLSKWEFFIKLRAALLAPILPWVMKEGESKEGSSHFNENLSIW